MENLTTLEKKLLAEKIPVSHHRIGDKVIALGRLMYYGLADVCHRITEVTDDLDPRVAYVQLPPKSYLKSELA